MVNSKNELILNIEKLHTTDLGIIRIKRNLSLDVEDVVSWCREKIQKERINYNEQNSRMCAKF